MLKKVVTIKVETLHINNVALFDGSSGIEITALSKHLKNNGCYYIFTGLWPGEFILKVGSNSKKLDTNSSQQITWQRNNLKVSHSLKIRGLHRLLKPLRTLLIKPLFNFGWEKTFIVSDRIVAVCDYLRLEAEKQLGKRVIKIPIGINKDSGKTAKTIDLKHPAVCIIQNHQIAQKSEALANFSAVIKALPNVSFYISKGLPENQDSSNTKRVFDALRRFENVNFVEVNSGNKFDYLKSTDIYALVSGLDCTPATILEAGLTGKPILASSIGGVPEMIINGKTGWAISNKDTEEWINKINLLINNQEMSRKIGQAAKEHVLQNYETSVISKKIYDLF
jgi:glycosyltransferase involved in cell wall biosynthesis